MHTRRNKLYKVFALVDTDCAQVTVLCINHSTAMSHQLDQTPAAATASRVDDTAVDNLRLTFTVVSTVSICMSRC